MLANDVDLTLADVQGLAGRDALAAFFARLGYNTNERVDQTKAAMGFTSDGLASNITHIERLASQDGAFFEIYLFELRSVTVAATAGLVRAFRDRPGDYLLVLTRDYEQLDFVLVQRYSEEAGARGGGPGTGLGTARTVRVRPRVVSINRRKPDQHVVLRVLRRFSYTEADTFAQFDKLVSAYDVADWSEPYFNNRALFSDYFLNTRLPDTPEWQDKAGAATMTAAFKALRAHYADARQAFSNKYEDEVRTRLLKPVLGRLGFSLSAGKPGNSGAVEPDYRLYAPGAGPADRPLAVCLAYGWARNLDGKDETRDSATSDENPGDVVVALLEQGEADWAIMTNGKIWRLYAARAHSRATNYYEIDLEETLALPPSDLETAFRYFWLLFRAAAFVPQPRPGDTGHGPLAFVDWLLAESARYARELEERLKDRVFSEIFPHFARGFISAARRAGRLPADLEDRPAAEREALLKPYFSGTLTFLYRLLFLLYAESRDLLPVREARGYHAISLERLKSEIAAQGGPIEDQAPARLAAYSDTATTLYDRLRGLFAAVDQGDPARNVPVYNGGLFITAPAPDDTSPEGVVARFLAEHAIPDRDLALGLDRMARDVDEKSHALVPIDYKSLGVRQLGSIYEGLLEFAVRVAPEPMAVVKGKKTEEIGISEDSPVTTSLAQLFQRSRCLWPFYYMRIIRGLHSWSAKPTTRPAPGVSGETRQPRGARAILAARSSPPGGAPCRSDRPPLAASSTTLPAIRIRGAPLQYSQARRLRCNHNAAGYGWWPAWWPGSS